MTVGVGDAVGVGEALGDGEAFAPPCLFLALPVAAGLAAPFPDDGVGDALGEADALGVGDGFGGCTGSAPNRSTTLDPMMSTLVPG